MIEAVVFGFTHDELLSPRAALLEWLVGEGERVAVGDPLCRYEVDKAIASFHSPAAGFFRRRLIPEGGRIARGDIIALLSESADEPLPPAPLLIDDGNEDADDFDWSEIDNRAGPPEPLGVMRRAIAQRMAMSKRHIPCFYLTACVDMSACLLRRREMRRTGWKATFNDMAIRASALALLRHPKVASIYTPEGLVPRGELNIGFAASLPDDGLVVPVVKRADRKSLSEIAAETRTLAEKAKLGALVPEDCSGGVFSVSYLGSYDVDSFVAIVNPGEAAIVAMGKTLETPVVENGQVVVRPIAKLTMSCDHRSIDGSLAARFMTDLKRILESEGDL